MALVEHYTVHPDGKIRVYRTRDAQEMVSSARELKVRGEAMVPQAREMTARKKER